MAENGKSLSGEDTQDFSIRRKIEVPIGRFISKEEYEHLKNMEAKFHKLNEKRGVSILNRLFLAGLTFVLSDVLNTGLSNVQICLISLLGLGLIIGHYFEFR